jgi:hypothetical protein
MYSTLRQVHVWGTRENALHLHKIKSSTLCCLDHERLCFLNRFIDDNRLVIVNSRTNQIVEIEKTYPVQRIIRIKANTVAVLYVLDRAILIEMLDTSMLEPTLLWSRTYNVEQTSFPKMCFSSRGTILVTTEGNDEHQKQTIFEIDTNGVLMETIYFQNRIESLYP